MLVSDIDKWIFIGESCFEFSGSIKKITIVGNEIQEEYLDYTTMIERLHPHVKWQFEEDQDYQGDFFGCGHDIDNNFYFIQGSFGSCSGCDWLQGISTDIEAREILNHFYKEVIVKPNWKEMKAYISDTKGNAIWAASTLGHLITKMDNLSINEGIM
jgi:hypothetical protein